jgi:hypothetical protein
MKPSEGIARIDAALADGLAAIDQAVSMFHGTVPPPPWPSPELYQAIDEAKDVRERLDVFRRHGDPDFNAKTPQVARVVAEVQRRIDAVETNARALRERGAVVDQRRPAVALQRLKQAAQSPKWIGVGLLIYLLYDAEKRPRRR